MRDRMQEKYTLDDAIASTIYQSKSDIGEEIQSRLIATAIVRI